MTAASEAEISARVRLAASQAGVGLWRVSAGACREGGRYVPYGLLTGADSKASDLIGIRRVVITPDMVGRAVGIFVAREVKRPGAPRDDRYHEQQKFLDTVNSMGGDARFTTGDEAWK